MLTSISEAAIIKAFLEETMRQTAQSHEELLYLICGLDLWLNSECLKPEVRPLFAVSWDFAFKCLSSCALL